MEFWGIGCLMVAGYPLFLIVWLAMFSLIRVKRHWLWGLVSIPASLVAYVVAFFIVFAIYWEGITYYRSRPEVIFESSFGFAPTSDVQIVNSIRNSPTKWDEVYLAFNADRSTIDRILNNQYTRIPAKDVFAILGAPSWWTPDLEKPGTLIYITNWPDLNDVRRDPQFRDHELLIYDPESKKAFLRYMRWE
jgi:hypothetical protein